MPLQLPIGTVMPFAGDVTSAAVQTQLQAAGWLPCTGSTYPSTGTYAALFAAIGNAYGGDAQNFAVPDLRGRFMRGVDPAGQRTGPVGSLQAGATALPRSTPFGTTPADPHSHQAPYLPRLTNKADRCAGWHMAQWTDGTTQSSGAGAHQHQTLPPGTDGAGGDAETRPINVYCDYVIKFQ
jgi:microcystin-dependent protein